MNAFRPAVRDVELVEPPADSISKIVFNPKHDLLAVASWDNNVRIYEVSSQGQTVNSAAKFIYSHDGPVLDACWSPDGQYLFSAGCDNAAKMWSGSTQQAQQVAAHDAPIKCCCFAADSQGTQMLVTGGWDGKVRFWNMKDSAPMGELNMGNKVYAMDVANTMLVIATANRRIKVVNLDKPREIFKEIESPLKWQTRTLACFPDGSAFAIGSIEGRVAIHYPMGDEKSNYSFKCHRYDIPSGSMPGTPATVMAAQPSQNVFAVNTIVFHKEQGTFCTGGADGSITFWDGVNRTKVKPFSLKDLNNGDSDAKPPQWGIPVVSASFNHKMDIFAYALSYDWSQGHTGAPQVGQNPTKVMLHLVKPEEVKRKDKATR